MENKVRYYDKVSVAQVIGSLYKRPTLFEDERYTFNPEDYGSAIHRLLVFTIQNLFSQGARKITPALIEDHLKEKPSAYRLFNKHDGHQMLADFSQDAQVDNFEYYYSRVKKFTLLRSLETYGVDVRWIYDWDNLLDIKLKEKQEHFLNETEISSIASMIAERVEKAISEAMVDEEGTTQAHISDGLDTLIERLKAAPEVGVPLYGGLINTITRGARLKKFYLRSAPTGAGKTRTMLADAINFAVPKIFVDGEWVDNGTAEKTLFITTELEVEEIQTMALAFISGIPEGKILNGDIDVAEEHLLLQAIEIYKETPLFIEHISNFSIRDIEMSIRRNVRENGVAYAIFDYVHTSLKILEEVTRVTNGMKLREDQILFLLSTKLKDLANELGIFMLSATQLNGSWEEKEDANQNLLRGSKAIADRIDFGEILMKVTQKDMEALQPMIDAGYPAPTHVRHIYKNRRGEVNNARLWCVGDMGTCRMEGVFITDNAYQLIAIDNLKIEVKPPVKKEKKQSKPKSAF